MSFKEALIKFVEQGGEKKQADRAIDRQV